MLCNEIYVSALALLGESMVSGDNDDYEERAPYIIAAFCSQAMESDKALRIAHELEPQGECDPVCIPLNKTFPLSERFATAAALYLGSMLVIDSNEELSDKLYHRFCEAMANIPAVLENIENKYF